jgi:hypothetical protein
LAHKIAYDLYEYQTKKPVPGITDKEIISLSKEQLKKYEGIYPNVYFGPMEVKLGGKKLKIKSPVMPTPLVLIPHIDKTFSVKAKLLGIAFSVKTLNDLKVEFEKNEGEQYMYFNIQNRMLNPNIRIEPFKLPREYKSYEGKYKVVNMANSDRVVKDVKLKINGNEKFSIFKYTFLGRHNFNMVIQPIDKQNAKFAGVGYFLGDKIRWEKADNKIFMYWSGLKLEKK